MASEKRQLPQSNITRMSAIDSAEAKNTALGGASFLTAPTQARLAAIQASYRAGYDGIAPAKQAMVLLSGQKNVLGAAAQRKNSRFIQVFNLAVEDGIFPAADRAFYKLDVGTGNVPEMSTDAQILQVGKDLVKGEADRIAAGGGAMAMPAIAEVNTAHTNFNNILMPHSTAVDAYDQRQEALDALNPEADAVIKKVWDEVDTFYNEEEPASQRQNAREWGVVYVLSGSPKTVTGIVADAVTALPIEGAEIFFRNGNKTVLSAANGSFELTTTLMGVQDILAEHDLHLDFSASVTLVENEDLTVNILMQPVV